ncbi:MAG: hypothetical protein M3387_10505, partial [Actinomycetota bacterium]|nr:hypothetical protein [Actinomycetota bacterium]
VASSYAPRTGSAVSLARLPRVTIASRWAVQRRSSKPFTLRLSAFAAAGGVVRFAQFEATGVDSTARLDTDPPVILVNARLTRTDPLWIAPLVAHDTTFFQGPDPGTAEAALAARQVEDLVCDRLLAGRRESRGCTDAEALLAMPDPLAALRAAGYR